MDIELLRKDLKHRLPNCALLRHEVDKVCDLAHKAERAEAEIQKMRDVTQDASEILHDLASEGDWWLADVQKRCREALQSAPPAIKEVSYSCLGCGQEGIPASDLSGERHAKMEPDGGVDFCGPIVTVSEPASKLLREILLAVYDGSTYVDDAVAQVRALQSAPSESGGGDNHGPFDEPQVACPECGHNFVSENAPDTTRATTGERESVAERKERLQRINNQLDALGRYAEGTLPAPADRPEPSEALDDMATLEAWAAKNPRFCVDSPRGDNPSSVADRIRRALSQPVPAVPDIETLGRIVDRSVQGFRLSYQVDQDGDHTIGLVDALTPEWHDSIVAGREECRYLIDRITNELHSALAAAPTPETSEGGTHD